MEAKIDKASNTLVISIPLTDGKVSSTGKTLVLATGQVKVGMADGRVLTVACNAYTKP